MLLALRRLPDDSPCCRGLPAALLPLPASACATAALWPDLAPALRWCCCWLAVAAGWAAAAAAVSTFSAVQYLHGSCEPTVGRSLLSQLLCSAVGWKDDTLQPAGNHPCSWATAGRLGDVVPQLCCCVSPPPQLQQHPLAHHTHCGMLSHSRPALPAATRVLEMPAEPQ